MCIDGHTVNLMNPMDWMSQDQLDGVPEGDLRLPRVQADCRKPPI